MMKIYADPNAHQRFLKLLDIASTKYGKTLDQVRSNHQHDVELNEAFNAFMFMFEYGIRLFNQQLQLDDGAHTLKMKIEKILMTLKNSTELSEKSCEPSASVRDLNFLMV